MPTDVENWKSEAYGREVRDRLFEFAEEGYDSIPDDERDAWFESGSNGGACTTSGTDGQDDDADRDPERRARTGTAPNYRRDRRRVRSRSRDEPDLRRRVRRLHHSTVDPAPLDRTPDVPAIFEKLAANGLSTQQACGDSWRNIVGNPVAGKDGQEVVEAWPVIRDLNQTFKGNDDHANLPGSGKCP